MDKSFNNLTESKKLNQSCVQPGVKLSCSSTTFIKTGKTYPVRETHSFTGALEELRLEPKKKAKNITVAAAVHLVKNMLPANKNDRDAKKVVECDEQGNFKTYDVLTSTVVSVSKEILNYQGTVHQPNELAAHWTKDCRTWLWKENMKKKSNVPNVTESEKTDVPT